MTGRWNAIDERLKSNTAVDVGVLLLRRYIVSPVRKERRGRKMESVQKRCFRTYSEGTMGSKGGDL